MRLCELRQKEVINCRDCARLGFVGDIEFNVTTGCLEKIIVPGPCKFFGFFGSEHEYVIPWSCIRQIGPDIILVDIDSKSSLKENHGC
ncbi:MAG: YlmC/YmxH family sporulation protein [Lachnospiraceae bacterium]|nr:YlmC/YmxH family sporulation protein [Lachnospiraceae bacterium]